MSTDQSTIFGNQPNSEATPPNNQGGAGTPPNVQLDPAIATLLGEIKNERGEPKYATLQDAIVALKHSQEYIPQLKGQLSQKDTELENARASAAKIEELERTVLALTQRQEPNTPQGAAGLTPEQVAELVNRSLTERETAAKMAQNTTQVVEALKSTYGAEAERKYNEKAAELGLSVQEMNALAAKSPKVVLQMLGAKPSTPSANPTGSVNTAGLQPHNETFVGRNAKGVILGATSQDLKMEQDASNKMVEELHAAGMSVHDLTDPKEYFKRFGKT